MEDFFNSLDVCFNNYGRMIGYYYDKYISLSKDLKNFSPLSREEYYSRFEKFFLSFADKQTIAEICHVSNKIICESIGDFSQKDWCDCEESIKQSIIDGVEFLIEHSNAEDSALHDNWCKYKFKEGWTYGEEKDLNIKTHPCLVSFESLPTEQQIKDTMFMIICKSLFKYGYHS